MVPTPQLVRLVLLGAPLWLLALAVPAGWVAGAAWYAFLGAAFLREWLSLPRRRDLDVRRVVPPRLSLGERDDVVLEVENRTGRPWRIEVHDEAPEALEGPEEDPAGELPPLGRARLSYAALAVRRGAHRFGRVLVRVGNDRGLVCRQVAFEPGGVARIYPRFRGVDDYRLLALIDQRDEVVRRPRRLRGAGTNFESLRPYLPGEDLRNVDWKASARRGMLTCRNMQVEKNQQVAALIDVGRLMGEAVGELPRIEHAMNAAVMLAYVAQTRGDAFGAICFSNRIESILPPVRGASILTRTLECLYDVHLRPVESDYWQGIAEAMSALRRRSLVIMLTDVLDAAGSAGLINNLARAARRHLVLCVVMTDPRVREAACATPSDPAGAWRKAAACDLSRRRRLALEHMRSRGILVLETSPERLSIQLVQRYLEIRQAGRL